MTETLGCTTPFLLDKSNICKTTEKSKKAIEIEYELFQIDLDEICPKSCWKVHTTYNYNYDGDTGEGNSDYYLPGN